MTKVPSLSYRKIVRALQRDGWIVIRQKGSHIRLQKRVGDRPVKRSTLSRIIKQAELDVQGFLELT
ncbi:MAG: type II toxin-antitoxin system HicA family toxin [Nitrospinae bacterium]|nr:type II toxin-antitoxin system HicA family toxin [Nitrospinota bacterium]